MPPIRLTLYNHKGGVGKTTLAVNIGAALARQNCRVLLVDSDPQCNLTSYFFADEFVNDLLNESDKKNGRTLWSALKPVIDSIGDVQLVDPFGSVVDDLHVLPGDIRLSEFEQSLADFWTDCFKRRLGGFRATAAISLLVKKLIDKYKYDFVIYDTGPNIGPLNRSLLLDCDFFIVPVACDLFSVRALATLGQTLKTWIVDWKTISDLAPDDAYLLPGKPAFLGYIPQRFKVYGQAMTHDANYYFRRVTKQLHTDLVSVLREIDSHLAVGTVTDAKLGEVKDFGSLVQQAQMQGVPLSEVQGGISQQKSQALIAFNIIATNVTSRINASTIRKRK